MRRYRILLSVVCVAALSLMPGCMSSKAPATRFYVLNPLEGDQALAGHGQGGRALSIEIGSLRLPQYLERPQLVTRGSENRLELAEFHQWGGNLRKNMVRVLARNLTLLLGTPLVALAPSRLDAPPDFRLEAEVMQFERVEGGRVRLLVQWSLSGGKDRKPMTTRITELASPPLSDLTDPEPTVAAMSALMGKWSRIIARTILEIATGADGKG